MYQTICTIEPYLQEFHQLLCDEGAQADHTFKFANMIMASVRSGKVFHASYDCLSLGGFCNFNRLTHTKSNDEIRPLLELYKEVRENAGVEKLKRFESDGGTDKALWPTVFPELLEEVRQYRPKQKDNLPVATLSSDRFVVFKTVGEVNDQGSTDCTVH
jgi:hypothetical protein